MTQQVIARRARRGRRLSLVIPMHNEEQGLSCLFDRLDRSLGPLGLDVEIVCVDDGSRDHTYDELAARARTDSRLRLIVFSRNFGKEAALTAGIEAATGDIVIPLDADLQDPPELIPEFMSLWEQGYDVVYGVRTDRTSDTAFKRVTAQLFYRVFNLLSENHIPESAGDFRLMDRSVVEAISRLPERNRFMKGLFAWVGFRQVGVPYTRPARSSGQTSWGALKLVGFAVDGLTAFTTVPLRVWTSVGLTGAMAAALYAGEVVFRTAFYGRAVPGYASLMVVLLLSFAAQMIALGVLGEYIGRMYQEVKGRPLYIVRERIGFDGRGTKPSRRGRSRLREYPADADYPAPPRRSH